MEKVTIELLVNPRYNHTLFKQCPVHWSCFASNLTVYLYHVFIMQKCIVIAFGITRNSLRMFTSLENLSPLQRCSQSSTIDIQDLYFSMKKFRYHCSCLSKYVQCMVFDSWVRVTWLQRVTSTWMGEPVTWFSDMFLATVIQMLALQTDALLFPCI